MALEQNFETFADTYCVWLTLGGHMVLDTPDGALAREASRLLVTTAGSLTTSRDVDGLSSALRAHIGNLAQFGLDELRVDELLQERGTVEVISAVAIQNARGVLSHKDQADLHEAIARIEEIVRPLMAPPNLT